MHEHKRNLCKICFRYRMDTYHAESKHILQPPKYLTIIVNRFDYMNNYVTKNSECHARSLQI